LRGQWTPDWKPKVSYDVNGEEGELVVKQGSAEGAGLSREARNEWDISLNDELPTDLIVQMGAGESDLDSLTLTGLDLQMGRARPRWISRVTTRRTSTPA
jgi:hypothetical protein